jgi:fucose permease
MLSGFLVSGFLFSFVGALLPAWGYDVSSDYASAGRHFLSIVLGVIAAGAVVRRLQKLSTRFLLVSGCSLAAFSLAILAEAPAGPAWRIPLIFVTGAAAGLLHSGLFEAIVPAYERAPAKALNLGGIFFGAGSIFCALLISGVFWSFSVQAILRFLAILPAAFAVFYATRSYAPRRIVSHPRVLKQFRSGAALLFASLLFFQFGNEWSIAAWLPLLLIHRLGMSPVGALQMLAFYFAALTAGRITMSYVMPRAASRRILAVSAAASLFGCVILALTNNRLGAAVSIALLGLGFAPIYPLLAAWIGRRFPYYHPGFFNGIFSIALAGGMLTPWLLGEIAGRAGIWTIITLPAAGTCMVVLLLCLIWVEQRVTGE